MNEAIDIGLAPQAHGPAFQGHLPLEGFPLLDIQIKSGGVLDNAA